jgi:transposase-like protein
MARRRWTDEQKREAVAELKKCRHVDVAAKWGVARRQLYAWRKYLARKAQPGEGDAGQRTERQLREENEQLKRALAKKVVEADFLQGVLRRLEARRRPSSGGGETAFTSKSK